MKYHFKEIEAKWQKYWAENKTFASPNPSKGGENKSSPPLEGLGEAFYVLDMFPYPSGAGLHVGHPLGYIASDIYARYKRHKGFNVLHPMGYDSFGLPAEQYAIQTGQHPAITTETNINRYREQLDRMGFSFDWSREVRTSDPDYYKWTQWIFIELFNSWYNKDTDKAEPIETLIALFSNDGNKQVNAICDENIVPFTAEMWNAYDEEQQQKILLQYRLTYLAETEVNWCPALGTVLANDEIVNGVSERGGHPVVRKKMKQWSMRISAYAERLLQGLETIDWSDSIKETQRNWIGKSVGALIKFQIPNSKFQISVFTTRPDTIFGVGFMTLAPEHELVAQITTDEQKEAVEAYVEATAKRSERERMADVKTISGVFTGAYAEHPFTKEPVPIWIGDYVLASYGTGAVMAVPCGDERDYAFAKHFNIPIKSIFKLSSPPLESLSRELGRSGEATAFTAKEGFVYENSDFLNGLGYKDGTKKIIEELEKIGHGNGKTNYRLRDAVFSRQRYWGEPIPVYYKNDIPYTIPVECLPLELPEVEKYLPTEDGQPPLGRATVWAWDSVQCSVVSNQLADNKTVFPLELNTMPGWAGSSWYLFRYMDAENNKEFASKEALDYWQNVDLYIGGSEHATGHLLYSRFWTKFLKDRGFVNVEEPFKKLINQGMILGNSAYLMIKSYDISFPLFNLKGDISIQDRKYEYPISSKSEENTSLIIEDISKHLSKQKDWFENFNEFVEDLIKGESLQKKYFVWNITFEKKIDSNIGQFCIKCIGKDRFLYQDDTDKNEDFTLCILDMNKITDIISKLPIEAKDDILENTIKCNVENLGDYFKSSTVSRSFPVPINLINDVTGELSIEKFILEVRGFEKALFIKDSDNKFFCYREVEKMSKSKYNVVNPDDICDQYGADTLRMYEMFLGPLEQAKPWNTAGITGVHSFLKKLWKLYHSSPSNSPEGGEPGTFYVSDSPPSEGLGEALKVLHKTIKKVEEDIENFSFNTSVSTFMIAVNELTALKCNAREVLEPLAVLLSPYAPHIAEELWNKLGHAESISTAPFPTFDEKYLVESTKEYPISFNGKMRFTMELPLDLSKEDIEKEVMAHEKTQQYLEGRTPKKVIVVPGKIINIVG